VNAPARRLATLGAALLLSLAAAAPAAAAPYASRDAIVPSFDGAPIVVTLHPAAGLQPGQKAPTILQTHGWAGSREKNAEAASTEGTGNVGVGPLRHAGFNVLTWDSRGFGDSGGVVGVDAPGGEGRDVQVLLDWLAKQPEALLDAPGDPRAGMEGVSYAGGIELVAAGLDKRIDAIAPTIAWHSLLTSLYPEGLIKGGWASALVAAGVPAANEDGLDSPAGPQTGGLDPHITSAFSSGASSGQISPADQAWFASRGPGDLVKAIRVPTLLVQGTADTLFTLNEAITNLGILRADHVPAKMVWFCGGHGVCLTGAGTAGHVEADVIAWMHRYLARDASVDTGPGFEWLADDAQWRSAPAFPTRHGAPLVADGAGTLAINPSDAESGTPVSAAPAANAINVPVKVRPAQVAGRPVLRMTYTATGTGLGHAFAQIVDNTRNVALGNQVTPIPIVLDGAQHVVTRKLDAVAASVTAASRYTLQIIGGSDVYGPVRTTAQLTVANVHVALPTVATTAAKPKAKAKHPLLPARSTCAAGRRLHVTLRNPGGKRLRSARVHVGGKRAALKRRKGHLRATRRLHGSARYVRVRATATTRAGAKLRDSRRYRACKGF
jgi:ABC-2 type transport system ATP-binding protein